jgi:hypothetical protein
MRRREQRAAGVVDIVRWHEAAARDQRPPLVGSDPRKDSCVDCGRLSRNFTACHSMSFSLSIFSLENSNLRKLARNL